MNELKFADQRPSQEILQQTDYEAHALLSGLNERALGLCNCFETDWEAYSMVDNDQRSFGI